MAASPLKGAAGTVDGIRRDSGFADTSPAVYFDVLEPDRPTGRPPVVMVHGGGHTGTCYLATPDGRPGWAAYFARRGHRVFVPDWPGMGRSGFMAGQALTGEVVCRALGGLIESVGEPVVLMTHSMSGVYGWKLVETHGAHILAVVGVAPSAPGDVQPQAEVISRDGDEVVVRRAGGARRISFTALTPPEPDFIRAKFLGPDSTRFPMAALDFYARGLGYTPPRLMFERQNVDGAQLRVADPAPFRGKRILVITGACDVDHTREVDGAVVDWLGKIGAAVEFRFLADEGIDGNGHMLMLEQNSDEIAGIIADWVEAATG
ncbi:MAG: alpha/beta fold hydrolase [Alphaproteobacteria bacterium]|nr:alpha/beta fold hydrolase [Alphaproteobacteria bacterium]